MSLGGRWDHNGEWTCCFIRFRDDLRRCQYREKSETKRDFCIDRKNFPPILILSDTCV